MIQPLFMFSDWGLTILRVVLGLVVLAHGWPKLMDLRRTEEDMDMMGFKPGALWGTLVACVESVGGLFLIVGLFTQLVGVLLFIQFVIVLFTVKSQDHLVGGFELELLIMAIALTLALTGGGAYGIDQVLNLSLL
jgi:putative oxidoreductase